MASRYRNSNIIDNKYYETFEFPNIDKSTIQTFSIRVTDSDRLDTLAFKYFGDGSYYWIIMWFNDLSWPFDFISGQILEIPTDLNEILKHF